MGKFLSSDLIEIVCTFFVVLTLTWYLYYKYCFNYWKKKGIATTKPKFPGGHILKPVLGQENLFVTIQNNYNELKSKGHKHGGLYFFNGPVYLPIDPQIVKSILTTDFEHFNDRGVFRDPKKFPLSANLFSYGGLKWKLLRNKLSPAFTSGKLKTMYQIFMTMTENFIATTEIAARKKGEMNIKYVAANYSADIIFSVAYGLESETLKYPDNNLAKILLKFFNPPFWLLFKAIILEGFQNPGNLVRGAISNTRLTDYFENIVRDTIKERDEKKIVRKDFLSLLLEIRDKEGLTFAEIAAQCLIFFTAGFETSSQTIAFAMHELAHNQEYQDTLRKEIIDNLGSDYTKYTYEDILKLPYLDKIFNETIRLYPVLGFFNRICVKPYKVPGTDVLIEKGTPVLIPALALQRDPEYFPDPLRFDPERFSEDRTVVPFTFLPFGDGPRYCIGLRFGKVQTKLGIAALISQFKFFPHPDEPKHVEYDTFAKTLVMAPLKGLLVKVEKIEQ